MKTTERVAMVKAMEYIARQVNDEDVFEGWLIAGVADGDIEYGDLKEAEGEELENLEWYTQDKAFRELMDTFLRLMARAKRSGGLSCDGITTTAG